MMEVTPQLYDAIARIVDQRVAEIKVTRELDKLTQAVKELVAAQRKTELHLKEGERVMTSAEALKRTDQSMRELAQAQSRQ
jgi:hypothetical protein